MYNYFLKKQGNSCKIFTKQVHFQEKRAFSAFFSVAFVCLFLLFSIFRRIFSWNISGNFLNLQPKKRSWSSYISEQSNRLPKCYERKSKRR